jgi:hypothetical protein
MELSAAAKWVEKCVRLAFDGVTLGCGMGLRESDAHDDGAAPEAIAAARRADEEQSWDLISLEDLHRYGAFGWGYLDAESLRFHLPAFILADLNDASDGDLPHRLIEPSRQRDRLYSLLNLDQRMAVREFLLYTLSDSFYDPQQPMIRRGLDGLWAVDRIAEASEPE